MWNWQGTRNNEPCWQGAGRSRPATQVLLHKAEGCGANSVHLQQQGSKIAYTYERQNDGTWRADVDPPVASTAIISRIPK